MKIIPSLLQKSSRISKTKEHINALDRRLRLWGKEKFADLSW